MTRAISSGTWRPILLADVRANYRKHKRDSGCVAKNSRTAGPYPSIRVSLFARRTQLAIFSSLSNLAVRQPGLRLAPEIRKADATGFYVNRPHRSLQAME